MRLSAHRVVALSVVDGAAGAGGHCGHGLLPEVRLAGCASHARSAAPAEEVLIADRADPRRPAARWLRPAAGSARRPVQGREVAAHGFRCVQAEEHATDVAGHPRPGDQRGATITAKVSGTIQAAGWASRAPGQPPRGASSKVVEHGRAGQQPAGRRARPAPDVGEAAPPDAQHQQRAERAGRQGERETDRGCERSGPLRRAVRHATATTALAGSGGVRGEPCRPGRARGPGTARPATETVRPEAVDRNAANAPAVTRPPSSCPGRPGSIRSGSSSTIVSAPLRSSSGR